MKKSRLAVFASGSGSNYQAIVEACRDGRIDAEVVLLVCDKPGAKVLERAKRYGTECFAFSPKEFASREEYETLLASMLDERGVDFVCLAGYMRIVGKVLLERYAQRIVNIHPSLLPSFKGAHAIQDAVDYGVKLFGVTTHFVDETLDGGRIIDQAGIVYEGNDIEELTNLIHNIEHKLYVKTINKLINKKY
ncbi:MAG: phosphoribosylglycinamide formyltransferase [Alistipes sp.]|nr:phosphoribosylglycinamide formyltransferase [Alistipes sp.]MBR5197569.1 phosphoribosylglycinamide formyltransferase [Alistipes sp.]MBR5585081.1 phosphoribosylglycinamide formyltransferase [Alistipes sp.]MBR6545127.1 phosphoribosylglycinamide formyltransferase [Alistipes sp.]